MTGFLKIENWQGIISADGCFLSEICYNIFYNGRVCAG